MKILFFMSHAGHARNFESTLRGLIERGHQVHMAFGKEKKKNLPGVSDLADSMVTQYPNLTSGAHPHAPEGDWSWVSSRLRASLDYMRYLEPEFSEASKLRRRAERFAPPRAAQLAGRLPARARSGIRSALRLTQVSTPVSESLERYLREQQPDVVLVTPLLEPGSVQVEFLKAANQLGIPTCLCVASWDNLTNKGLIHELPDVVTVWNEHQRTEAVDLHGVPAERVAVTGAAPYDHWFGWTPSRPRREFAEHVGLDPDRPFVLYVGSSGFIAPDEAAYVVEWIRELERQGVTDVQVLARAHPVNPLVGDGPSQVELAALERVKLYPPAAVNPTDAESRSDYFDSLYYSSAVAGVNTSAFLEAAILGRPVFTVLTARNRETQEGMPHFHHLLNAGGGLLHVANGYEEHAAQLREALAASHPDGCVSERSIRFTKAFVRPHGLDEPATPRMLDTIEELPARVNGKARPEPRAAERFAGVALAHGTRLVLNRERRRERSAKPERDRSAPRRKDRREKPVKDKHRPKAAKGNAP